MRGVCLSLVLLSAAVFTNAAVALYKAQGKPAALANLEGCYLEDLKKVIPYGDYYPEKSCSKYTCGTDNITQILSCGVVLADKRCQLISNENADYPDCCPQEMCGTISPEYLTGPPDNDASDEEEGRADGPSVTNQSTEGEGRSGLSDIDKSTKEESITEPPVPDLTQDAETSEALAPGTREVKSLDPEGQVNEILIAQANSNLGGLGS